MVENNSRMESENEDKLSDLPESILSEILKLLNIKDAIQTSILSSYWLNLSKTISHFTLHSSDVPGERINAFKVFVYKVLRGMDKYEISSLDLKWQNEGGGSEFSPKLLEVLMKKAIWNKVQKMTIHACPHWRRVRVPHYSLTLTLLEINFSEARNVKLPKSLHMPLLQSLNICGLILTPRDENGSCEPLSDCGNLENLSIRSCDLQAAQGLTILNNKLSHMTIMDIMSDNPPPIIRLSTPSLKVTNIKGLHHIIEI